MSICDFNFLKYFILCVVQFFLVTVLICDPSLSLSYTHTLLPEPLSQSLNSSMILIYCYQNFESQSFFLFIFYYFSQCASFIHITLTQSHTIFTWNSSIKICQNEENWKKKPSREKRNFSLIIILCSKAYQNENISLLFSVAVISCVPFSTFSFRMSQSFTLSLSNTHTYYTLILASFIHFVVFICFSLSLCLSSFRYKS